MWKTATPVIDEDPTGSFRVYEQIVEANYQQLSFWQAYYRNLPGGR